MLAATLSVGTAWTLQAVTATTAEAQESNIAVSATPSASYTSSWEAVSAINDGIDPPESHDTQHPRWGTWPEEGTQWVQLSWGEPVTVGSSDMYFFDDSADNGPGACVCPPRGISSTCREGPGSRWAVAAMGPRPISTTRCPSAR
ncbi:hypothetical protein GCM10029992_56080 [Glycomyces albus]